jgi:hypothetical protein
MPILAWVARPRDGILASYFERLMAPAYRFANESSSRVPLTDW